MSNYICNIRCSYRQPSGYCGRTGGYETCQYRQLHVDAKPITNADRIRAMTDEELAEFLLNRDLGVVEKASKAAGFTYKVDRETCLVNVIDLLKQEASDGKD